MTRFILCCLVVVAATSSAVAETGGGPPEAFFNMMGSMMQYAIEKDQAASGYPLRSIRSQRRSYPAAPASSWSVLVVNGSTAAVDSSGLNVSFDARGNLFLSLSQSGVAPRDLGPFNAQVVVNGSFVGSFPAKSSAAAVIVDEPVAVASVVRALKSGRSYDISTPFFRLSGSLAGSTKALEQVEQAARIAASTAYLKQPSQVTVNTTIIEASEQGSSSSLSDDDLKALEAVADIVANHNAQLSVLQRMLNSQNQLSSKAPEKDRATIQATIRVINSNIAERKKQLKTHDTKLRGYLTSVTPNNRNQYLTARRASEIYPRVPYYIPGTPETGEFWVEPFVTDKGDQRFKFHFVDPSASNSSSREVVEMSRAELSQIQDGLFKLYEWSEKAQKEQIRKIYTKRAVCFPAAECPADGEKGEMGKSSTEVRFQIYEDGSTAGRIQRNKGKFEEGYNVSIDSAMLLQAYSKFVLAESDSDYKQGTQSTTDLDAMFQ